MKSKVALNGNAANGSGAPVFLKLLGLTENVMTDLKAKNPLPEISFSKKIDEDHSLTESMHRKAANGDVDGALAEAKAGIRTAIERGDGERVEKIWLDAMSIAMYEALFSKKDLGFAIEVAKQVRAFATGVLKRESPEWIPLNFYMFAHRPNSAFSSAEVRRMVLEGMPDFSTNHVAQMEKLKASIKETLVFKRGEHTFVSPERAAELARTLKELSFLSRKEVYEENLGFIRETFREFAESDIARYRGYTPAEVEGILRAQIPNI